METDSSTTSPGRLRMTRQRRMILQAVRAGGVHMTADEIYDSVRVHAPNISLGTVYRNLEVLSRQGLMRKLRIGGEQMRFDGNLHPHYHIQCLGCGQISDIPADPFGSLEAVAVPTTNFRILNHNLEFDGLCPQCAEAEDSGTSD